MDSGTLRCHSLVREQVSPLHGDDVLYFAKRYALLDALASLSEQPLETASRFDYSPHIDESCRILSPCAITYGGGLRFGKVHY